MKVTRWWKKVVIINFIFFIWLYDLGYHLCIIDQSYAMSLSNVQSTLVSQFVSKFALKLVPKFVSKSVKRLNMFQDEESNYICSLKIFLVMFEPDSHSLILSQRRFVAKQNAFRKDILYYTSPFIIMIDILIVIGCVVPRDRKVDVFLKIMHLFIYLSKVFYIMNSCWTVPMSRNGGGVLFQTMKQY